MRDSTEINYDAAGALLLFLLPTLFLMMADHIAMTQREVAIAVVCTITAALMARFRDAYGVMRRSWRLPTVITIGLVALLLAYLWITSASSRLPFAGEY